MPRDPPIIVKMDAPSKFPPSRTPKYDSAIGGVLRRKRGPDLVQRPDVELALLAFAVGVLGGVESALGLAVISRST